MKEDKKFLKPEAEIVEFQNVDIITVSQEDVYGDTDYPFGS